ncbi:MAG TPA: hypothetical protein VEA77_06965 [Hyphomicrobium sp.]|nr:hypothetical protein [Hyphomicrobium sp.]
MSQSVLRKPNTAGTIKIGEKEITVFLREVTDEGAHLRLFGTADGAERFRLVSPMDKIDTDCVVVWRRGQDIGVKFEGVHPQN